MLRSRALYTLPYVPSPIFSSFSYCSIAPPPLASPPPGRFGSYPPPGAGLPPGCWRREGGMAGVCEGNGGSGSGGAGSVVVVGPWPGRQPQRALKCPYFPLCFPASFRRSPGRRRGPAAVLRGAPDGGYAARNVKTRTRNAQ